MAKPTLAERVEDHSKKIDRMDTLLAGVVGDVKKIQQAVNGDGNGNIGMGERLRDLKSNIESLEKHLVDIKKVEDERKEERGKWTYGIVMLFAAQAVATIFAAIGSAILWFVKIAPVIEQLKHP